MARAPADGYTLLFAAHLGMEMFKALFSSMPSLKPLIDRGAVVAIGMSGPSAGAEKMGIPEIAKAGLPEFGYTTWYGLFAPAGTPGAVITTVNVALKKAHDPITLLNDRNNRLLNITALVKGWNYDGD